jgi:HSP20 family molecular chaperone IbpA
VSETSKNPGEENREEKNEIKPARAVLDEPETEKEELPPRNSDIKTHPVVAAVSAALVREITGTAEEINKIRSFLGQVEQRLESFQQNVASNNFNVNTYTDGFRQWLKQTGIEENLKKQGEQTNAALHSIENALRQYLDNLRMQSKQLMVKLEEARPANPKPEKYEPDPAEQEYKPNAYNPPLQTQDAPPPPFYPGQGFANTDVPVGDAPARELHVDVYNEPGRGEILVVAEHPALQPTSVQVTVEHDILTLIASDLAGQAYVKELLLPAPTDRRPTSQTYRNGVLEIRLKKL